MMTKKRTALWIAVFSFWMAALSLIAAEDTSAVENDSAQSEISSQPLRNPLLAAGLLSRQLENHRFRNWIVGSQ